MEIVIVLESGMVHDVFCTDPQVNVRVMDVDAMVANNMHNSKIDAIIEEATNPLYVAVTVRYINT